MYLKQTFIILLLGSLSACASDGLDDPPKDSRRSDCIYGSSIRGYEVLDDSNLIIEASGRRKYHMGLQRRAFGIRSARVIAFDSPTNSVCSFNKILFEGQFAGESVPISFIREIGPEEEEALLIRFGKMEPEINTTPAPTDVPGAEIEELDTAATDDSSGD